MSIVNVAFPSIEASLDASESALSWMISGYNITVAAFLLIAGRLADSLGRRKVFVPGVAIFATGSLLSGLAPTAALLVAARVVQAIGGAVLLPSSLAVVLPEFPFAKRSTAIGIWGATGSLGAAFGPSIGSLLIELGNWRLIFLVNVPICTLVLFLAPRLLRESRDPDAGGRPDLIGVPVGVLAVALLMLAIVQSESWGFLDPRTITAVVLGLALLPVLIWRSAHHPEPLLDLTLYRHRSFRSVNIAVAFYSLGFTAGFLMSSLMLQTWWDLSIIETGLALTPGPLVATVISPFVGRYADDLGHRWFLAGGSALCAVGYVMYIFLIGPEPDVLTDFIPANLLIGVGVGMSIASWFSAAVSDLPPGKFGIANATLRTVQQVFYAMGISVVIALLAATRDTDPLAGFQWAWTWVACAFAVAAAVIASTFPRGSSSDRLATANASGPARPAG